MKSEFEKAFSEAESRSFPPFLPTAQESTPFNSTPYVTNIAAIKAGAALADRAELMERFVETVEGLPDIAIRPVFALLGGSAIGPKIDPNDLDCVVFYEAIEGFNAGAIPDFQKLSRLRRIDLRLIPWDTDPILAAKALSYFSTLYVKNRNELNIVRGLVIVDVRQ